jgi:hypothetical protein
MYFLCILDVLLSVKIQVKLIKVIMDKHNFGALCGCFRSVEESCDVASQGCIRQRLYWDSV